MASHWMEWVALASMSLGIAFVLLGSIGILKFKDVYLRLQASSKSLTFGFGFLILGVGLLTGDWGAFLKAATAVAFQFLTAPIAANIIAQVALKRGIDPLAREASPPPPPPKPAPIAEQAADSA